MPTGAVPPVSALSDVARFTGVIALSERAAPAAAYLRTYLGIDGPSFDAVMNNTNKFAMKRRFRAVGLPTADFVLASSPEQVIRAGSALGLPVVVKPVFGSGVDATVVVREADEFASTRIQDHLHRLADPLTTSEKEFPVLVERFLEVTDEYHCDGYVVDGEVRFSQVSRYLCPAMEYSSNVFGSYLIDPADPAAREVLSMHERAVRATGVERGVTHFEVIEP